MARPVGIDLGTMNSVVATLQGGRPTVVPNAEGWHTTPSVVALVGSDQRLIGQPAHGQAILNPKATIHSAKRFTGRRYEEVTEEAKAVTFDVVAGPEGVVRFEVDGRQYSPEEISAQILRKLADDAARYLGERVVQAVITVPAYFDDAQRRATKDAGQIAGLDVLRIINEPTAAALAYGLNRQQNETVLVFDLGGGTFDASILDVGDGMVQVRATAGDSHLGGNDFDRRLVDHLADEFRREQGDDLRGDPQAMQRLFAAAEKARVELSSVAQAQVDLPHPTGPAAGPGHLTTTVTRPTFERLTADLVERCRHPVRQAMADAKVTDADLDQVILVGGATRMPAVLSLIRRVTGGKDPNMVINPDHAVAMGAAIQAGALTGEGPEVLLLDVIPVSLGLATIGGVTAKLIERNTTIPTRRSEVFSTAEDNQPAMDIVVLQGEREGAADNRGLGRFRLEDVPPVPRGVPRIEVTFDVDANGILHVSARDQATGAEQTMTITGTGNLRRDEVDRMVAEAERRREEDELLRRTVDARNALEALTYQLERNLTEAGDATPAGQRARALVGAARHALEEEAPPERLRSLTAELQQANAVIAAGFTPKASGATQVSERESA